MSIIPFVIAAKSRGVSKNSIENALEGFAVIPALPIMAACSIYDKIVDLKDSLKTKVRMSKNKVEFKDCAEEWKKLSEGKVGQVERQIDGNSEVLVLHTENGPLIRTSSVGDVVLSPDKETTRMGEKTSYTGVVEIEVNEKKQYVMCQDFGFAQSEVYTDPNYDERRFFNTDGTILTETGEKIDCASFATRFSDQPAPSDDFFKMIGEVGVTFDRLTPNFDMGIRD